MDEIRHFVPGEDDGSHGLAFDFLSRLRWPIPAGVAEAYVRAYTRPSERVLVPFCQGPQVVREVVSAGRVAVAINFDPLLVLLAQVALEPPGARELNAAVARLGDSLKRGMPLRHYLGNLYASTCPACLRPAVAAYFIWDRELAEPVAKYVRCPACAWDGRTAVDVEDRERLAEVDPRGMHYHYLLDRIAPPDGRGMPRPRLERLLELYSARNLYALAELTLKIESLFAEGPLCQALRLLLADCLDRCSSLAPLPGRAGRRQRPQRLARPSRYLERNVWLAFEEAATRLNTLAGEPLAGLASSLDAFQTAGERLGEDSPGVESPGPASPDNAVPSQGPPGVVAQSVVRDLPRSLPPRSLRLILTSPPPLDPAAWSLSYLWGGWLLGAETVAPLQPLLRQRSADPTWYARVMSGSLATLSDLLRDDGRVVLVLSDESASVMEALVLAASSARLGLVALVQRGADYRLELAPAVAPTLAPSAVPLKEQIRQAALEAACETICARGEPSSWRVLHAAIHGRLAEQGLLRQVLDDSTDGPVPLDLVAGQVQSALGDPALERLLAAQGGALAADAAPPAAGATAPAAGAPAGEQLYWLAEPPEVAAPLSDRVEARAYEVLGGETGRGDGQPMSESEFVRALYAYFPGPLTPDAGLVTTCLQAYGYETPDGRWRLRPEDVEEARDAERLAIIAELQALGQRLGYRSLAPEPFDVAWFEGQEARGLFVVRWRAAVNEALALDISAAAPRPYLVIPGGRAALVSYKLAHNPLWQRAVEEGGWRFIKYRHVRQLAAQDEVDEYQLRTIVGLDPIVEQEGAQIPLF